MRCAAQAGEMVIRRVAPHRSLDSDTTALTIARAIRARGGRHNGDDTDLMGPLVVQEHEILHCIVERLPTRSRSFLPCGSRPPSSANTAISRTAAFGTSCRSWSSAWQR
jgi:hypothetical protein